MIVLFLILSVYVGFVLSIMIGVKKLDDTPVSTLQDARTKFSIVIPFKNEARNLPLLLQSLQQLHYPGDLYEIIMIDDGSTDHSVQIIKESSLNITLLSNDKLHGYGKKKAVTLGIQHAHNPWIVTTDADCTVPAGWLLAYDAVCRSKDVKILLGPVAFIDKGTFLQEFQQLEFLALQAVTMAGVYYKKPFLSNAANMAFQKQVFRQVKAFEGNEQIASGDDVFLLEKIITQFPNSYTFLKNKNTIVKTQAQVSFYEMIQQKIRWSGKTKHYKSVIPKLIGLLTLIINVLMLVSLILIPFDASFVLFVLIKITFDILLLAQINRFYKAKFNKISVIIATLIYPFYFLLVFIKALNGNYEWKGKKYTA